VRQADELGRVLDRDQPFRKRDRLDERLGEGRLARAGIARRDDRLLRPHCEGKERLPVTGAVQCGEFGIERVGARAGHIGAGEQPGFGQRAERRREGGGAADRQADRPSRHRGWPAYLHALPIRQHRGAERPVRPHVLLRHGRGQSGDRVQAGEVEFRQVEPGPLTARLDGGFARPVHHHFRRRGVGKRAGKRCEKQAQRALARPHHGAPVVLTR
jgi:hypothetical protein